MHLAHKLQLVILRCAHDDFYQSVVFITGKNSNVELSAKLSGYFASVHWKVSIRGFDSPTNH